VAASIPHFITFEMGAIDTPCLVDFLAALWKWALIAVFRMEMIIYMTMKVAGTVKPRTRANEHASIEPLRTVVAGRSTVVRSDVIITIRTVRGHSYIDANLSLCSRGGSRQADGRNDS
jgi:hypothetical protein